MNIIDIIIVVLLAIATIQGFRKGLIHEVTSLAALVFGVYAAFYFSDVTAGFLLEVFNFSGKYLQIFAFILTLVLAIVVISALGKAIEKIIQAVMLGLLNRLAGAVFGLLKGMLILSLLIMLIGYFKMETNIISKERQEKSIFYDDIKGIAPYLLRRFQIEERLKEYNPWKDDEDEPAVVS